MKYITLLIPLEIVEVQAMQEKNRAKVMKVAEVVRWGEEGCNSTEVRVAGDRSGEGVEGGIANWPIFQ